MSEAISTVTPSGTKPPLSLDRFDLERHPDADLLRLCATLARMRHAVAQLENAIVATPSRTADGCRAKALAL